MSKFNPPDDIWALWQGRQVFISNGLTALSKLELDSEGSSNAVVLRVVPETFGAINADVSNRTKG